MVEVGSPVIFLDVDGVLNNEGVFRDKRFGPTPIDFECVWRLHDVVKATGAEIVLSSSWRKLPWLVDKLHADRIFYVRMTDDWTKETESRLHEDWRTVGLDGFRGHEIAEWLSRHPEVTSYAIIDDESDMLPEQMGRFVQTSFESGLDDEAASALRALLAQAEKEAG